MQPLSFLSNSLRTTLTSTQPLPKILEKYSQRTHPFQKSQKAVMVGNIPSFNKYSSSSYLWGHRAYCGHSGSEDKTQ